MQDLVTKLLPGCRVHTYVIRSAQQPTVFHVGFDIHFSSAQPLDIDELKEGMTLHDLVEVRGRQAVDDLKEKLLAVAQGPKPKPKLPKLGDVMDRGCCG